MCAKALSFGWRISLMLDVQTRPAEQLAFGRKNWEDIKLAAFVPNTPRLYSRYIYDVSLCLI